MKQTNRRWVMTRRHRRSRRVFIVAAYVIVELAW